MPDGERDNGNYHAGVVDTKLDALLDSVNNLRDELKADRAATDLKLHSQGDRIQAIELRLATASGFWSGSKWIATAAVVAAWELLKVAGSHLLHGGSKT